GRGRRGVRGQRRIVLAGMARGRGDRARRGGRRLAAADGVAVAGLAVAGAGGAGGLTGGSIAPRVGAVVRGRRRQVGPRAVCQKHATSEDAVAGTAPATQRRAATSSTCRSRSAGSS